MAVCDAKTATKNMSRRAMGITPTKDGVLSKNAPSGTDDDNEFPGVNIKLWKGCDLRLAL
jgi:hypothetical protein